MARFSTSSSQVPIVLTPCATRVDIEWVEYRLGAVIGRGGSGRVLEVFDPTSGVRHAMKIVATDTATLLDEYTQLARLHHPSLPRVYDVGRTRAAIDDVAPGAAYFVAEWIDGVTGEAAAWDPARTWSALADLAGALATIHAAGLVHGDVAPQNVLVGASRVVLVDLGLASGTGARGTPAYMAPEALAGHVEPRSDLYGLGATIFRLVTGRPPFEAPTLGELVQRVVTGAIPRLAQLPAPLADLVARLVAHDLDARPASALAVLDELDQLAPAIGITGARPARPVVGPPPAPATWPGAGELADAVARDAEARGIAVVAGSTASGGREIAEAALRRTQLARVARGDGARAVIAGGLDAIATQLGVAATGSGYVERAIRAMAESDRAILLDLFDDPRALAALAAIARESTDAPRGVVIATVDAAPPLAGLHVVPMLDAAAVGAIATRMLGTAVTPAWARALHAASGGLPLTAIELLRSIAGDPDPHAIDWTTRSSTGASELRAQQLATVSAGARMVVQAIAIWGGRARLDHLLATVRGAGGEASLADVVELARAGLARRSGDEVSIDRATSDAALAGADLAPLVAAAISTSRDAAPDVRAAILGHATLDSALAEVACDVAEALLARGRADRAHALASHALAQRSSARVEMIAARAATLLARYPEAIAHARRALELGADRVAATLAIARAAQRAGDLDTAESSLAELHAANPAHAEVTGAYARLLVTRSRYAEARRIATAGTEPLAGLRAEAAGLAAFYLGALDDADRAFAALEAGADTAAIGRAQSLRGMVAQQRGQLAIAGERYREAVRLLSEVGERHAAATAELNLGTVLSERGRSSEALPWLAAAERTFEELGATTELVAARLDRGNALIAVGEYAEALRAAEAAIASAEGAPHLGAFARVVAGDAQRHLGDRAGAETSFHAALAIATDSHARVSAYIALAESALAVDPAVDVAALCASDDDRDRWTLARARAQVLGNPASDDAAIARTCAEVATRAESADRLERAFRGHALAAALARRATPSSEVARAQAAAIAKASTARARAAHAAIIAAAAPAVRAALVRDPDRELLPREAVRPARARRDDAPELRRLLTLSRRLNTEASVERILDEVIDTAIELSHAERGFLLLRQPGGELAPVVSRNFAATDLDATSTVSRSIAERAAQTGEAVVTVDAGVDERFGAAASVAALRLRSVLAVPLRQRGAITGCLYVDHRLRGGAFDDDAAGILGELADIAAIAIENARLATDLRRSTTAIDALNARLSEELAERDAELLRVKSDLPDRDRLRHAYPQIIGRSPVMMRMLDVVDRAAATSLPVVIVGESGTGKELVARALHDHGARKAAAFVAINCSAVPEPLLESELFGHVRGAFTGAERDRRGLFEVADGGTLFLDEIADTSPGMQAKLLRVLQDGLVRRVGDTKTRQVDVRVIAASQHGLAELAAAGRFREDLRFRLEVIAVHVPPLRDRDGDIPFLVEALLARIAAPKPPPRLTRGAARALGQHRWAGNVRELENALARGFAMGGDVIDLADLPENIGAAAARPEPAKPAVADDLRLKPAIAATEQAYISAAMGRAKGNQTVAARLLGLSRFGLQKKLRRLAGDGDADDD